MDMIKRAKHRATFYQRNKKRLLAAQKVYNAKHVEEIQAYRRSYYRRKSYGIDKSTFDKMLESQNNRCGICEIPFDLTDKKLAPHVDHDHSTGKIRSLLCMKCNCGLGNFNENPLLMENAIAYLRRQKSFTS